MHPIDPHIQILHHLKFRHENKMLLGIGLRRINGEISDVDLDAFNGKLKEFQAAHPLPPGRSLWLERSETGRAYVVYAQPYSQVNDDDSNMRRIYISFVHYFAREDPTLCAAEAFAYGVLNGYRSGKYSEKTVAEQEEDVISTIPQTLQTVFTPSRPQALSQSR